MEVNFVNFEEKKPGRLCHNRSTGSARVKIDILLAKLIKPEKTKILNFELTRDVISDLKVKSLHCSESSRPQGYRIAFEICKSAQ